jgi:hypothetical protein
MDKEFRNLQMETHIKEDIKMVSHMVMDNIFGVMVVLIKETLKKDFDMEKEVGENRIN